MSDSKTLTLGPLWFQPGITGVNLTVMMFAGFGTMSIISFMSFMQPYVFTELLQIPEQEQGRLTGNLHAFQEILFIAVAGFVGALSDKLGRPLIYALGFIVVAAGYALYAVADSVIQLYAIRALFAVGVATVAVMLSACTVDYIQERSRGRWLGTMSIFNGLGIVTMAGLLSRLPQAYQESGADSIAAGKYSFWTVASLCLIVGTILYAGLYRGRVADKEPKSLLKQFGEGVREGLRNPRLAVAYGGAFIGRGDFAVVGTYFSLWLTQVGIEQGMTAAAALKKAGLLFVLIQVCALAWAPVMGFITDRVTRLTALGIGTTIAGSGYLFMSQVPDPFGPVMYPAAVLLGMGETGVIISAGTLLGQEATPRYRGSIVGVFGLIGGLGILGTTFFGGQLFDGIGRTAPFAMMGLLNFVLLAAALYVRATGSEPLRD
jgi:MFS family permease